MVEMVVWFCNLESNAVWRYATAMATRGGMVEGEVPAKNNSTKTSLVEQAEDDG